MGRKIEVTLRFPSALVAQSGFKIQEEALENVITERKTPARWSRRISLRWDDGARPVICRTRAPSQNGGFVASADAHWAASALKPPGAHKGEGAKASPSLVRRKHGRGGPLQQCSRCLQQSKFIRATSSSWASGEELDARATAKRKAGGGWPRRLSAMRYEGLSLRGVQLARRIHMRDDLMDVNVAKVEVKRLKSS
ncbi:hypothetical protein CCHR01_19444 [Colletotrichum chrysophilum]|uniref:Uncharacterized protein n=1 Tax=Colletotrichum chrysophilum TaxID=1836956 RepID=A0AAD9E7V4_9PEZI|nr:hypothetical protein CCHR01_19444 [Colletotrichum chrysophilum]